MGFIIHRAGEGQTLLRQVSGDALRIGRDAGAGLRLDDDAVALDHAEIRTEGGRWVVEDRGSVTGTYLNGEPVGTARLAAGDELEIGGYRLRVQITHPEDPLFLHVTAVGAGAAEAPRPARGSTTGLMRLDELLARARETGAGPRPAVGTESGALRRLEEIAAASTGPAAAKRPASEPVPKGTVLRRLDEIVAAAEERAAAERAAARRAAAVPPPAAPAEAEHDTSAVEIPEPEPEPAAEHDTSAVEVAGEPEPETRPTDLPSTLPVRSPEEPEAPPAERPAPELRPGTPSEAAPPRPAPEPGPVPPTEAAPPPSAPEPRPAPRAPAPPPPPAAALSPAARRIDYAAAYALPRPGLTKGSMTLFATVAAVVAVAALATAGSRTWFMPGISSAHARIVGIATPAGEGEAVTVGEPGAGPAATSGGGVSGAGAGALPPAPGSPAPPGGAGADTGSSAQGGPPGAAGTAPAALDPRRREVAERGCLACHRPWRGPAAVEEGCAACHAPQAGPHAALLAGAAAVPACAACHPEHRDRPLVRAADERPCLACHRDLAAAVADVGRPVVATRVTSFAAEHPELVVELPAPGGGVRRLALDDPAARTADPSVLDFDHRRHRVHLEGEAPLEPVPLRVPGLDAAEVEQRLRCASCHQPDRFAGTMAPIVFEQHCQACHRLTFDARYPDCQMRHGSSDQVLEFLLATYALGRCPDQAGGGEGSLFDRRRDGRGGLSFFRSDDPRRRRLEAEATEAAVTLFRSACDVCHRVDLDATPVPAVTPPAIPAAWLPGARFSHLDHREFACARCHPGAAASSATADLLLTGIETCRSCHGEQRDAPDFGGLLTCGQCHPYHRETAG